LSVRRYPGHLRHEHDCGAARAAIELRLPAGQRCDLQCCQRHHVDAETCIQIRQSFLEHADEVSRIPRGLAGADDDVGRRVVDPEQRETQTADAFIAAAEIIAQRRREVAERGHDPLVRDQTVRIALLGETQWRLVQRSQRLRRPADHLIEARDNRFRQIFTLTRTAATFATPTFATMTLGVPEATSQRAAG
jgi:hypothetical protein